MSEFAARRLEDLIADLARGLAPAGIEASGIRPVDIEFSLPVEMRIDPAADGPRIVADVPRTRTRTAFDPPLGRLVMRLGTEEAS
jgi:hypothetical protein